jgi:glycosyltransferase involved in cell wall biosynthesis
MSEIDFTVATPTYNRKHTLPGAYESLRVQTFRKFEWLIVDDGSNDGTAELVRCWQREADFPIRYFYQSNSGKHVAFNRAVRETRGELYLSFDSDDLCIPETLERFKQRWEEIPDNERSRFSGLSVLCKDERGNVMGDPYPEETIDASSFLEQLRLRSGAERWGIIRTEILRRFPFPEFAGERFIPEALVWNRIALRYKMRFVNEALRVYRRSEDSLMSDFLNIRLQSPRGTQLYYAELCRMPLSAQLQMRALVNYLRFSLHAGRVSLQETGHPWLAAGLIPASYLAYRRDCL